MGNFENFPKEFEYIAKIGQIAESLIFIDPASAIAKFRLFGEKVTLVVASIESSVDLSKVNQVERIDVLKKYELISQPVADTLHLLRKMGNDATHIGTGTHEQALLADKKSYFLLVWLVSMYGVGGFSAKEYNQPVEEKGNTNQEDIMALKAQLDASLSKNEALQSSFDKQMLEKEAQHKEMTQEAIEEMKKEMANLSMQEHRRLFKEQAEKIFTSEETIEKALIEQLTRHVSQWTYNEKLKTEEDLWENFRQKLQANNLNILGENPLTDQEFRQVQNQLNFANFYEASKWLTGENGIAKVRVQREDASLGTIMLSVLWREDIAGGHSSYEVVNQVAKNKQHDLDRDRRFDVILLINGLPMIHIELKNKAHSYYDAFYQIDKYIEEDKFTGIFSTTQMFVVSNGTNTRYVAARRKDFRKQKTFLSTWVDEGNNPVNDLFDFAEQTLSIPQAHKMVTQYSVIDNSAKALILLRPYQIHAIEAVRQASKQQKSGYIWHTTGSGKTLTSYKVARNLLQIPSIEKTIFIVDRVDLDQQTSSSFTSYAENDVIDVDQTDDVKDLMKKLRSNDQTLIVTTIQKLNIIMKRATENQDKPAYKKLHQLKVAFVVDECHRAVSSHKQKELQQFFINSLWYGFTGTPIFKENNKDAYGNLARTTKEQYGECLHEYTVKEAIHDKAVLGFQVEYKRTFDSEELELSGADEVSREKKVDKIYYESQEHMEKVVHQIINLSSSKLNLKAGVGNSYDAIFTTSSISQAIKYYEMFCDVKKGTSTIKVKKSIQRYIPDFPKVAITYSISENEESSVDNQEHMKKAIADYNQLFGTSFGLDTLRAYNEDINARLARKREKFADRKEQLDLVIVVDRLLTGFDAPCLSTLFIDRRPMAPQNIIQAFSRTNRLFDSSKRVGRIVTFQSPAWFEESVKEAFFLYSNGGEEDVLAPSFEEAKKKFIQAIHDLKFTMPNPKEIVIEQMSDNQKRKFAKVFQTFDRSFSDIQVYSEYEELADLSEEKLEELRQQVENSSFQVSEVGQQADNVLRYLLKPAELETYQAMYKDVLAAIKPVIIDPVDPPVMVDLDYELETMKVDEINYEYLLHLIQAHVTGIMQGVMNAQMAEKDSKEITGYIDDIGKKNPQLADSIRPIWQEVQENPQKFQDEDILDLIETSIEEKVDAKLEAFAQTWAVDKVALDFVARNYRPGRSEQAGEKSLLNSKDYASYKERNENPLNKLKYNVTLPKEYKKLMEEEILPLLKR